MRYVRYAGEELLTGDAIAEAVVQLAEALVANHSAAHVRIPVQLVDGVVGEATLLVSPATQLVTLPGPQETEELVDEQAVAVIRRRLVGFQRRRAADSWYDDL